MITPIAHFQDADLGISLDFPDGWYRHPSASIFTNQYSINPPWDLNQETGIALFVADEPTHACHSDAIYQSLIALGKNGKLSTDCRDFEKIEVLEIDGRFVHVFFEDDPNHVEGDAKVQLYLVELQDKIINITLQSPNVNASFIEAEQVIQSIKFL